MSGKSPSRSTPSRKKQHVELTLGRDVRFRTKTTGLQELEFVNNALPELDLGDIDTSVEFLDRRLELPFMVSCMTGGYRGALGINKSIAAACEELGIAMGVGSQRQALEDAQYHRTFSIVRDVAPSIPIVGNIGAGEVARINSTDDMRRLVDLVRADAFAVHLNPLQEFLQPEGNTNFRNVLKGISNLVKELPVPVIAKEIGAGISPEVARRLLDAGVRYIDVAGAGGTSWAGVEALRRKDRSIAENFWDWGIPTATALRDLVHLRSERGYFYIIASGGITSGMEAAKCLALGANLVASARPVLLAYHKDQSKGIRRLLQTWADELRGVMFLTGSATVSSLQRVPLVRYGEP
jgi:isopentenyl-diphosphate delta-isomerase